MVRTVIGVILLLIGLSSEVGYLWQLARGQAALLWQAKPLERVIKDPDLAPEQRQKLEFVQAVKRFDPDRGFLLATYDMWWIRASIQEYILHHQPQISNTVFFHILFQ